MRKPRICASIVSNDLGQQLAKQLKKPWIACNRSAEEGGNWQRSEAKRREELLSATELGAEIIDIELVTGNLKEIVQLIKKRAKCLLSFHDLEGTPPLDRMREIVQKQLEAGADICKVVTTAQKFEDNLAVLQLISDFPKARVISFAMGPLGFASRILCPLVGGDFIYASIAAGKESASGQITVRDLRKIYRMVGNGK